MEYSTKYKVNSTRIHRVMQHYKHDHLVDKQVPVVDGSCKVRSESNKESYQISTRSHHHREKEIMLKPLIDGILQT